MCVHAGQRDRGALLSQRDTKGPQKGFGGQRTNAIVNASQAVARQPNAYVVGVKNSCSL